ncbi:alpha/beta hydrolase [Sphaerisporangium sp. NPDC088356]|uniref:alpha/beta fold hydrolase n=1 Tax=Sphaerisporangium sp. NPDC088356 TaxID=3154871 RepID=UPI0034392B2B
MFGVSFQQRYYDAGGVPTRVLEAGDGPETVVLLHGSGGHAEAYVRNIGPLAEHFRVLAVDMLGHGLTGKPDRPYEIPAYVEHLRDVLDAVGADRAHLSGESLGGWVAAQFAVDHPDRVNRLILNTAGGLSSYPEVMKRFSELSRAAVRNPDRDGVRKRLQFLMLDPANVPEDLVEMRYLIYKQPGFEQAMDRILCLQEMPIRERNLLKESDLQRVTAPTLVVWTTHDPTAPVEIGQKFADAIPDARLEVMKDCGHWPQFEDAETFNRLAIAHLTGAETAGTA